MGQPALSEAEIADLPKLEVLGVEGTLVEINGPFADSMTGRSFEDATLLALVAMLGDQALFVKLSGPREEVQGAREGFLELCRSLAPAEGQ